MSRNDTQSTNSTPVSRRRFMVIGSVCAASMLLPPFVTRGFAGTTSPGKPAFRISLAGDLLKAFREYLEYDRGQCANHAIFSGSLKLEGIGYQINIDSRLCESSAATGSLALNPEQLYLEDLFLTAASVKDLSFSIRTV